MSGRLYTESEVLELMQLVLKLNVSCLQFSQGMGEIFEIAEALNAMRKYGEVHSSPALKCGALRM